MNTDTILGKMMNPILILIAGVLIAYNIHFHQNDANFNANYLGISMEIMGFVFMIKSTSKKITLDKNAIKSTELKPNEDIIIYPVTSIKNWNAGITLVLLGLGLQLLGIGWNASLTISP